jgi:hypothetical protein
MSDTATQLQASANAQIHELIGLLSSRGEDALRLPCPGREKLGDGTVGAIAAHTADNYHRIAEFIRTAGERTAAPASRHRIPRFLLARGHSPGRHDEGTHDAGYTATDVHLDGLLQRLSSAAEALTPLTAIKRPATRDGATRRRLPIL